MLENGTCFETEIWPSSFADYRPTKPLLMAMRWEKQWVVEWLLVEARVDPNVADRRGVTPLHLAARQRSEFLVDCLVAAGAYKQLVDAWGRSALWNSLVRSSSDDEAMRFVERLAHPRILDIRVLPGLHSLLEIARLRHLSRTEKLLEDLGAPSTENWMESEDSVRELLSDDSRGRIRRLIDVYGCGEFPANASIELHAAEEGTPSGAGWYFGDDVFAAIACRFDLERAFAENPELVAFSDARIDRFGRNPLIAAIEQGEYRSALYLTQWWSLEGQKLEWARSSVAKVSASKRSSRATLVGLYRYLLQDHSQQRREYELNLEVTDELLKALD